MLERSMRNAALLACTSLLLACSPGEAPRGDESPVVARVGGQSITRAELEAVARAARERAGPIDWDAALRAWIGDNEIQAILDRRERMRAEVKSLPR